MLATTTCLTCVLASTACERVREIFQDDDGFGARVVQLVLQLARGIQRIDVDDGIAGAQHGGDRDRILQHVRHHDRHARAFLHAAASAARRRSPCDILSSSA